MAVTVTLVGAQDRTLESRLQGAGIQPVSVTVDELATLAHPLTAPPDVVVLDLRNQTQIPPALSLLRRQHPDTGLIIVASALEPTLMLEAMRAGVTECVTDLAQGDLEAAVARMVGQRDAPESGEVFVFVGAKGGVGTTTTAVNVATSLAKIGTAGSTLYVDLHAAGGDAALYFGSEPRFSVSDALENTHRLDASYFRGLVDRTHAGVDLLASADRAVATPVDSARVRTVVTFATRHYRYTVIDIPRSDAAILDSLAGATQIVIVANHELATVRGASRIITMLTQRYGKDKVSMILSRSDRRAEIGLEDLEKAVGLKVAQIIPSDYRLALDALHRGRPMVLDSQSALAAAFKTYARELGGVAGQPVLTPGTSGFLGRLTGRSPVGQRA